MPATVPASPWKIRSFGPPSFSATTKLQPRPSSACASSAGPKSGEVRTATLGWARQTLTARRGHRPWALTVTASSHESPARAKASATEDEPGKTRRFSLPNRSPRRRTMPKKPGSPDASTTTGSSLPSIRASASARSPFKITARSRSTPSISRCRPPPATIAASASRRSISSSRGLPSRPTTVMRPRLTRGPTPSASGRRDWLPQVRACRSRRG